MSSNVKVSDVALKDFQEGGSGRSILQVTDEVERLGSLHLDVSAVLGQKKVTIKEVETLEVGNLLELDRSAGHIVDVYVGKKLVAHGEIDVMDDNNFGVSINEVLDNNLQFLKEHAKHGRMTEK